MGNFSESRLFLRSNLSRKDVLVMGTPGMTSSCCLLYLILSAISLPIGKNSSESSTGVSIRGTCRGAMDNKELGLWCRRGLLAYVYSGVSNKECV